MCLLQRKLVGDVVPHQRRGGKLDRVVESGEGFIVLPEIEIGVAQADLQFGIVGCKRCGFFQLRHGQIVLVPLGIHGAQIGVGKLVERIDLELFVEGGGCVVVFAILPVGAAQIVVGEFVVGIYFRLLLQGCNGCIVIVNGKVG